MFDLLAGLSSRSVCRWTSPHQNRISVPVHVTGRLQDKV
jgi:hypothetical protein